MSDIVQINLSKSEDIKTLATELTLFIKENNLCQKIQDREYVNFEGWQYAGARLGIVSQVKELINLSSYKTLTIKKYDKYKKAEIEKEIQEYKYQCRVALVRLSDGVEIGFGFAICSNTEAGKNDFAEYAIASMCQTRAIGKAYRNQLAWVIKAAGFEPNPPEEIKIKPVEDAFIELAQIAQIDALLENPKVEAELRATIEGQFARYTKFQADRCIKKLNEIINGNVPQDNEQESLKTTINNARSIDELEQIGEHHPELNSNPDLLSLFAVRENELLNN